MSAGNTQYGDTRVYGGADEATSPAKVQCPLCKIQSVPRPITSTRRGVTSPSGKTHCLNCGHTYSTNKTDPAE